MDLVTLVLELITSMFMLAIKPFSLFRIACVLGIKSLCIIIQTWIEILRDAIGLHSSIIRNIISWIYAVISLPSRVVFALQRESLIYHKMRKLPMQLQSRLYEMEIEIEKLKWSKKELEARLQKAVRELKMMEAMLAEVEDEHDEAIVKIEQLESKLKNAKEENLRLKEVYGTVQWTSQTADNSTKTKDLVGENSISSGIRQRKPKYLTSKVPKCDSPIDTVPLNDTPDICASQFLGQRALLQSVFSSILSLLVGMIIWEAKDPCMPLVLALFTVVGMSLKSVVQAFSTIENKPASDAVALLSLNWFILGALTYPTLPRVAYMVLKMHSR